MTETFTMRDLPLRYMVGLRAVPRSQIARNMRNLMRGSQELFDDIVASLAEVLEAILDRPTHDDFDRAIVQLSARLVASCRAAYDCVRLGHLLAANAMTRDALEYFATCLYLEQNRDQAAEWISASTLAERRRFGFGKLVKRLPEEFKGMQVMFDLLSMEAHPNHLAVTYLRFRKPAGYNFYLAGCYSPGAAKMLLEGALAFPLTHLDHVSYWYRDALDSANLDRGSIVGGIQSRYRALNERLDRFAERAQAGVNASETAFNLSPDEILFMEELPSRAV